ncbi:tight adherence protein C [Arthrobacter silviterrae]|uniref:Type II secretion system F family protein n=1 Tax=Arthrobacter silviterrae TaxID=2026658 RepID=A0ABX0DAF4_9MICC|nr:type II secretion system F family protein [Arthrobacter silviterrae]MDQ0279233.1 tight adherence protein C [Arthrobacter silviterrae]NGN83648.1 type II secretion system F family protein [Arthrobacter silviterrae]
MTALPWIFIAIVVLPLAYLVWAVVSIDTKSALIIRNNLSRGVLRQGQSAPAFGDRGMLEIARKFTPVGYTTKLDMLLARAGRPASMPLPRLLVAKPLLGLGGATVGLLFVMLRPGPPMVLLGLFLVVLGYFIPDLLIWSKAQERQTAIQLELPDTLDQMLISVEAGLGFESSMARAGANGKGPMAEELVRTLQDMQMGRPRRDSYKALADRTTVPELKSFVRAVVQADIYGIGIAKVLRTQAQQMRVKRRQRAEQKAMKLPVLVLFPLLLFIFPTLFIIIMGPAVINVIGIFTRGGALGG